MTECFMNIFELHELHQHVGQAGRSLLLLSWLHQVTPSSKAEKVGLVFADGLQRLVFLKSGKGLVGQLGNGCQRLEIPVRRTTVKRFPERKQVSKVFLTLRRRQEPWSQGTFAHQINRLCITPRTNTVCLNRVLHG